MNFNDLPKTEVTIDMNADQGPLELWRQSIGHGGINSLSLPASVVDSLARLRPRLTRIFIQEFFNIYPEHGRYDWSKLDPYMDAVAKTGAKIVAAITIKPKPLYPTIDPAIWRPNDVTEWQSLIAAMVKRYSVDKPLVTYWEIGNETDIGEDGGCPYLIKEAADYVEYYKMTIEPILATFPMAKVGGPAVANSDGKLLPEFIDLCHRDHLRLDFISWHLYNDDPDRHALQVRKYRDLLKVFGDKRPEMLITEWNKTFEPVSVEDAAYAPHRAAVVAASIIALVDAKMDWTFYYHVWDQACYAKDFEPIFLKPEIMYRHWNEIPHRFGLFGVNGEVRPQYFVYQMLSWMGDRRIAAKADGPVHILASRVKSACATMLVNDSEARVVTIQIVGLTPGEIVLKVFRIDSRKGWSAERMELEAIEQRHVDVLEKFSFQIFGPSESVSLVLLEPANQ